MRWARTIAVGPAVIAAGVTFFLVYAWFSGDDIDRANWRTRWLLASHALWDRTPVMKSWLFTYHGEAPGTEVMRVFADWCISHPSRATAFGTMLSERERAILAERLVWAAIDSERVPEFKRVFGASPSQLMSATLSEISRLEKRRSNPSLHSDAPQRRHAGELQRKTCVAAQIQAVNRLQMAFSGGSVRGRRASCNGWLGRGLGPIGPLCYVALWCIV